MSTINKQKEDYQRRLHITQSLLKLPVLIDSLSKGDINSITRLLRRLWPGESDMKILNKLNS